LTQDPASESWHLDKRVPIVLIITLTLNSALGIWYASKLDSRVGFLEFQQNQLVNIPLELGQMKEQLRSIDHSVERINNFWDDRLAKENKSGN